MSEWTPTPDSSNVAGFGYDEPSKVLTVAFKSGKRYEYYLVQNSVYLSMKSAPSTGKFLNAEIKGKYKYKEL